MSRGGRRPPSQHIPPSPHLAATCKAGPGDPHGEQAKGWAPVRERHPWPDSGAGGVSGDLVQVTFLSK